MASTLHTMTGNVTIGFPEASDRPTSLQTWQQIICWVCIYLVVNTLLAMYWTRKKHPADAKIDYLSTGVSSRSAIVFSTVSVISYGLFSVDFMAEYDWILWASAEIASIIRMSWSFIYDYAFYKRDRSICRVNSAVSKKVANKYVVCLVALEAVMAPTALWQVSISEVAPAESKWTVVLIVVGMVVRLTYAAVIRLLAEDIEHWDDESVRASFLHLTLLLRSSRSEADSNRLGRSYHQIKGTKDTQQIAPRCIQVLPRKLEGSIDARAANQAGGCLCMAEMGMRSLMTELFHRQLPRVWAEKLTLRLHSHLV